MTPGTKTLPGESKEILDRRPDEENDSGQKIRYTRKFCEKIRSEDEGCKKLIEEYHQSAKGPGDKAKLEQAFKTKLKGSDAHWRAKMGLTSAGPEPTDAEISTFLSDTGSFENQFLAQIETDYRAKEKARENMIDSCLEVAHDEYDNFDETELRKTLKKEGNGRLRTFLENTKYRKTYIKKLPGGHTLTDKSFSDIDFDEISRAIGKLDPTNPKRREIQEAWIKIASVAHPEKNLAQAFSNITSEGGPQVDIAGAYATFFGNDNTCVSRENREKILNFLTRHYVPLVPLTVLEMIDPGTSQAFLMPESEKAEFEKNLPADPELSAALKKEKEEYWEKLYRQSAGGPKNLLSTRGLPYETKIRILSQFGSIGKAEQMLEYYQGKPYSLRKSTDSGKDFRKRFIDWHGIHPEKLEKKSGLVEELTAKLGHQIEGLELFEEGCVMQWKTKNKEKDITGYFIIDTVPSEDVMNDNIITVRFLGDGSEPFSPNGLTQYYTGADFFHYLSGCTEDGKITFRDRSSFEREMENNAEEKKLPHYFTEEETEREFRAQFPDTTEIPSIEELNHEIDQILNPRGNNPKESKNQKERALRPGMVFTKISNSNIDTFQITDIDDVARTVTLWDGWGTGKKSVKTMSFSVFAKTIKLLKQKSTELYRLPTGGNPFGIKDFNQLCLLKEHYGDGFEKKMKQVCIGGEDGKTFGKNDPNTGNFTAMPIIKIGDGKDLYIDSIEGSTVHFRKGTFTQAVYDEKKQKWKHDAEFAGYQGTMSLPMLWSYLAANPTFTFEKLKEKQKIKKDKDGKVDSLSWWNILMHTHSLGVILHGDLWNAPFKAWEEQHHKDHAFAGKMTAALVAEKLQNGKGPISGLWNNFEFPALMVADGNSSFQSYLDELVKKVDDMGSYHRTKLIKKWAKKEHFPSVKFMAAMCASMQIFGQLYPYDIDDDDYRSPDGGRQWFWYNSIVHSLDPQHKQHIHMPPHGGEWPEELKDKAGNPMTEIQACHKLFGDFEHPMLKNLGRRFQKYAFNGQDKLQSGGKANLNERTTMEGKLEWMMGAIVGVTGKPPEAFGDATELWLREGYPTEISTMPYAALLFSGGEQRLLPATQEHIKDQFQSGYQVPMFAFMQNKDLGDTFRETGIAFAYTISEECGGKLEKLVHDATHDRLRSDNCKKWTKDFSSFWKRYGAELMYKLSGMRDPTLNLMVNEPRTFNALLDKIPASKKGEYGRLTKNQNVLRAYYDRLANTYGDTPGHAEMPRGKGFYFGDHFRFRDNFGVGYPIAWINWGNYLDANLDKDFATTSGGSTSGDGVFKEMKEFFYHIPQMAKKMAKDMGLTDTESINSIAEGLYRENIKQIRSCDGIKKLKADRPEIAHASMPAMMLGMIDIVQLSKDASQENVARYTDLKSKMKEAFAKAEKNPNFVESIPYRERMAKKFRAIVEGEIDTRNISLSDIENTEDMHDFESESSTKQTQQKYKAKSSRVLGEQREAFEKVALDPNKRTLSSAEDTDQGLPLSA